ncbi:hypothetical protein TNCV_4290751 [Trichonephila clavipes]|nr:hypothetical protein TNCV_4290751 [Trichonephila clavipes]
MVETASALQTKSFLLTKKLLDCPLTVRPRKSLKSSRGLISEPDMMCTSEAEILQEFSVTKSSTTTQANLLPSQSSATVISSSKSQPPIPLIETVPTTFNSLSTSAASSLSNKALSSSKVSMFTPLPAETCPVIETSTIISNIIPFAPQAAK